MTAYKIISQPETEPITLSEAKRHLNIADAETYWDDLITSLIISARQTVEDITWRPLITQEWRLYLDSTELVSNIYLNKCPLISVESIKYTNTSGDESTLDVSKYQIDLVSEPGRIKINTLPTVKDSLNAVYIDFTCGYGASSDVPEPIKSAIKLIIGHLYEHREDVTMVQMHSVPQGVDALLSTYKQNWFYPSNN